MSNLMHIAATGTLWKSIVDIAAGGWTIHAILEYYAILCLAFMPVSLIGTIIIARRTTLFDRIDDFLDRILPPNPKGKAVSGEEKKALSEMTERQRLEMSGVSTFSIQVGETYQCHVNYQNRGGSYGEMEWYNDDEFVGKVNDYGLFRSLKTGTSNIFCVGRGGSREMGIQAYSIRVLPTDPNWFADTMVELIRKRTNKTDVLVRFIKRKILKEHKDTNILVYSGLPSEGTVKMVLQFDEANGLVRGAYYVARNDKNLQGILKDMNERYEEIRLRQAGDIQVFIHQVMDTMHEEVDVYGILMETRHEIIVAFGKSWRSYGEKDEFLDNIQLGLKLMKDIVPEMQLDGMTIEADVKDKEPVLEKHKRNTSAPKTETVEEITPEPEPEPAKMRTDELAMTEEGEDGLTEDDEDGQMTADPDGNPYDEFPDNDSMMDAEGGLDF